MVKKQISFRLEEDVYMQFKDYLAQKNMGVQEILEQAILEIIKSAKSLNPKMQQVIRKLFENELDKLKSMLIDACLQSLILLPSNSFSVQVIIDEFGEIQVLRTASGWSEERVDTYLLWEFHSINIVDFYYSCKYEMVSGEDADTPFRQAVDGNNILDAHEFSLWLKKKYSNKWDESLPDDEYVHEASQDGVKRFVTLIYEWCPDAYKVYRDWLIHLLKTKKVYFHTGLAKKENDGSLVEIEPLTFPSVLEFKCLKIIKEMLNRNEIRTLLLTKATETIEKSFELSPELKERLEINEELRRVGVYSFADFLTHSHKTE